MPRRRRGIASLVGLLLVGTVALAPTAPGASAADGDGADGADGDATMALVDTIPFAEGADRTGDFPITVDTRRHLAFTGENGATAYDIEAMERLGTFSPPSEGRLLSHAPQIDTATGRVFMVSALNTADLSGEAGCDVNHFYTFDADQAAAALRSGEEDVSWTEHELPCFPVEVTDGVWVDTPARVSGYSYYEPEDKLLLVVESALPANLLPPVHTLFPAIPEQRSQMVIWQLDAQTFELDWSVDLSARCETKINDSPSNPVVTRVGQSVISYCYVGRQGRAVHIPLDDGRPRLDAFGEPVFTVAPTIGGKTNPVIDPRTGRLLIYEDGKPLGPAIWVYDPPNQRFFGVVPSGVERNHEGERYELHRGFDTVTGRSYILNHEGFVMANLRQDPLPGGQKSDAYTAQQGGPTLTIAVDGPLRRVLVQDLENDQYLVFEDRFPEPAPRDDEDLDRGTANIPEVAGETQSAWGGNSSAFGAHAVVVGGVANLVNNADLMCTSPQFQDFWTDSRGRCPADRSVTAGNRDVFLAPVKVEFGSESGTSGVAAATGVASGDTASDADARSVARCGVSQVPREIAPGFRPSTLPLGVVRIPRNGVTQLVHDRVEDQKDFLNGLVPGLGDLVPGFFDVADTFNETIPDEGEDSEPVPVPESDRVQGVGATACDTAADETSEGYAGECGAGQLDDPARTAVRMACYSPIHEWQDGTQGGFPSVESICTDFGGTPDADEHLDPFGRSAVSCDWLGNHTAAAANASAVELPVDVGLPEGVAFHIADARSWIDVVKTDEGLVTVAHALASGVTIGPFSISHVETIAVTKAHGRAGTTQAEYFRNIGPYSGPGAECEQDCGPEELVDGINQFFQGRVVARLPEPRLLATPKGFRAVAGKDEAQEFSDRVVNDDDTKTFNAIDFLFINDVGLNPSAPTSAGKSRVLVSLAGVQAESNYGVFPLLTFPEFAPPDFTAPPVINPTPLFQDKSEAAARVAGETVTIIEGGGGSAEPAALGRPFGASPSPYQLLRDGWGWFVNRWPQALLLFGVLTILFSPAYFASRRRVMNEALPR